MRVELTVTVRGEERCLVWEDGALSGDDEVLARLDRHLPDGAGQSVELVDAIGQIEAATAQRVTFSMIDDTAAPAPEISLAS